MELKIAALSDIEDVLALHYTLWSRFDCAGRQGRRLVRRAVRATAGADGQEQGLFIARQQGQVVGYIMAASWQFWSAWPMFAYMIQDLPKLQYRGHTLSVDNSYQYGPVCLDKRVRGSGVLEDLFAFALQQMSRRYPVLVTFVNKNNPRHAAHTRKVGLEVIAEFEYNNNHYYEMACLTQR